MAFEEDNGIVEKISPYSVAETLDRLTTALQEKGIQIFARIDQSAAAKQVGLDLRPTELLIFGDPRTGTPLMDAYPSIALDLPLKALAWQAEDGTVRLIYSSPAYFQKRHHLPMEPFAAIPGLIEKVLQ